MKATETEQRLKSIKAGKARKMKESLLLVE